MSADRLRQAAQKIRDTAGPIVAHESPGWWHDASSLTEYSHIEDQDAAHIALWSPPVALAVADWLDRLADENGDFVNLDHPATRLADLILRGAS